MNERLVNFIRANEEVYTREALTKHLLNQGYSQEDIDEAWAAVEAEPARLNPPVAQAANAPQRSIWAIGKYWWTALGFFLGVPLLIGIISRIFRGGSSYEGIYSGSFTIAIILIIAAFLGGLIGAIALWNSDRPASRGLLFGLILSLIPPFIGLFIIAGICLAG